MALSLLIAFLAGTVAFLSPCVLPLLPGYAGYMTGGTTGTRVSVGDALPRCLAFVGGLTLVFVALGAGASVISEFLKEHKRTIEIFSGSFVIVLGSLMIFGFRGWLASERRFHLKPGRSSFNALALGAAFAFGWTPCIGPTLGAALNLAATSEGLTQGIFLLLAYSIGLGLPFVAVGLGLISTGGRITRHARKIQAAGGVMLVGVGSLMITGRLTLLTIWAQRSLGRVGFDFWNF